MPRHGNVSGMFGKLIPFGIGLAAQAFGLGLAIWLLLVSPIVLYIGLPRHYLTSDPGTYDTTL